MLLRAGFAAAVAFLAFAASAACGGGSGNPPDATTARPVASDGPGAILFTQQDGGIYEFDIKSGETRQFLIGDEPNTFLLDPRVAPDGTKVAYVEQPPAKIIDNRYDAGADLWIANRDGSGRKRVYQHEQLNALVRYPQWADDTHVVAIIQEISEQNAVTQVAYTVQRVDVTTGAREKVVDDAFGFTISPDGTTITYARAVSPGIEVLESKRFAGGEIKAVVPTTENLQPLNSPRYSPDGSKIAFASADQSGAISERQFVSVRRASASLDGLPEDIWLVDVTGAGRPRRIADLKEDLPALTWNGDGTHIYVIGAGGLYDVNLASGAVTTIGEGSFHGQLDWAPS